MMVQIIYADVEKFMKELLNTKWMRSKSGPQTIVATVKDYGDDVTGHMHSSLAPGVMQQLHKKIVIGYLQRFLGRHHECKSPRDRDDLVTKLTGEIEALDEVFTSFPEGDGSRDRLNPTKVVTMVLQVSATL